MSFLGFGRSRGADEAAPSSGSGSGPEFLIRFRDQYSGFLRRRDGWRSPVEGGLDGFAHRTQVDAYRDAIKGIPEANWGLVPPRAVLAVREVAEGEMAAIGAAWQRERRKHDPRVARRGRRFAASRRAYEVADRDVKQAEYEIFDAPVDSEPGEGDAQIATPAPLEIAPGAVEADSNGPEYQSPIGQRGYAKHLDQELRHEHFSRGITKDDFLRYYETRFSVSTIGYWLVIAFFTLAEFPLNEKVFTQLGDEGLAVIVAAGLGVVLISAAHFVGVTFRRFADMWEANLYEELDAETHLRENPDSLVHKAHLAGIRARIPKQRRGLLRSIGNFFVGRKVEGEEEVLQEVHLRQQKHMRAAGLIALAITGLVIVIALFLGYARGVLVQNENTAEIERAASDARTSCLFEDRSAADCEVQAAERREQAEGEQIEQDLVLATIQYGALQVLIFVVAAALTFHHHSQVVNALKQARARLSYLRRRRWLADRRLAYHRGRTGKAVTRRWARYNFRRDQAEAMARFYRSAMDYYYEVNLQSRNDASDHGAEISAQPRPKLGYPGWMSEELDIPEEGITTSDLPSRKSWLGFRTVQGQVLQRFGEPPAANGDSAVTSAPDGDGGKPAPVR